MGHFSDQLHFPGWVETKMFEIIVVYNISQMVSERAYKVSDGWTFINEKECAVRFSQTQFFSHISHTIFFANKAH